MIADRGPIADVPMPLINVVVGGVEVDAYFPEQRLIVEVAMQYNDAYNETIIDSVRTAFSRRRARSPSCSKRTSADRDRRVQSARWSNPITSGKPAMTAPSEAGRRRGGWTPGEDGSVRGVR